MYPCLSRLPKHNNRHVFAAGRGPGSLVILLDIIILNVYSYEYSLLMKSVYLKKIKNPDMLS